MRSAIVTGSAGFIGFFICKRLLEDGFRVVGIDSLTTYYDVKLKEERLKRLRIFKNFKEISSRVETPGNLMSIFKNEQFDIVVHLAAQAGVRYSIDNPREYLETNLIGTFELLEAARAYPPKHMLMASTSSTYGANTRTPYTETDKADHQVSFYAATKKSMESMSHSYAHLFNIPVTIFRFFTVYGPWGRPDMAPFKFTKSIFNREAIDVYNFGDMQRDFTFVTDLTEAVRLLIDVVPEKPNNNLIAEIDSISPVAPWRIVNIGNSKPVKLVEFIEAIEEATEIKAIRNLKPIQLGDVKITWADPTLLKSLTGYVPTTNIRVGMKLFVEWYVKFYEISRR